MKVKLFTASEQPPTTIFNSNTRLHVKVTPEKVDNGWAFETEDMEAASSAVKDFGFLLLEPEDAWLPPVPNFSQHSAPKDFHFLAAKPEEIKAGKYLSFPQLKKAERLAEEEADKDQEPGDPALEEAEAEALRAKLTEAKIEFHPKLGLKKLRALAATIPAAE